MDLNCDLAIVTGANGWLGSRLVRLLINGLEECDRLSRPSPELKVRCLVLPGQDSTALTSLSPRVEVVEGDLREPASCGKLLSDAAGAVVFHTAGMIHPRRVRDFFAVNMEGTKNLMRMAVDGSARRLIAVSSNSPCGCNPHPDHLFDESSPYHPYMNYGRSKMKMEQAIDQVHADGSLETVTIRAPWFYGPQQPPRQTLFFRMIRDGKAPVVGRGDNLRSMAYVDNLCQGLVLAAITDVANGKKYWIADERPYSMNEIIDTVERLLDEEFDQPCTGGRMRLPGFASGVAWWMDATIQKLGLYHQKIHVLSEMNKTIACSVAKAKKELGYEPTVALEEGMRRSIRWCFEQGMLP